MRTFLLIVHSFTNRTLCSKSKGKLKGPKERVDNAVARKPGEYKLFAVFVFHRRSTADLISLGYADVPTRHAPPPPTPKPKKGKALTRARKATDLLNFLEITTSLRQSRAINMN